MITWSELLKRVGDIGASPSQDPWLGRYIRRSNHIGAFFAVCSLPAFVLGSWAAPVLVPVVALTLLGYVSPLWLNRRGLHGWARVLPLVAADLVITSFTLVLGRGIQAHAALFVVAALPFVLFDVREKALIVPLEILSASLYWALVITDGPLLGGHATFPPAFQLAIRTACVLSEFGSLALLLGIFFSHQRHQHDQLTATVTSLEVQIAERQKIEGELMHAKELAEAGGRAKSEFLATMSHELRTPMNAVLGAASLLREGAVEQEQRDMLETIETAGHSLLTLLNDLLDLSVSELGGLPLDDRVFNPYETVEGTLLALSSLAEKKGLDLAFEARPGVPLEAIGDVTRFRQILVKLLGNAMKFTSQGFVRVVLEPAEARGAAMALKVSVMDSGIGVPAHVERHLFETFTQSDSSLTRPFGGSGLGLALSQRLVRRMGGRIGFQSLQGTGSTFWFEVPVEARRTNEIAPTLAGLRVHVASRARALAPALRAIFDGAGATLTDELGPEVQVYFDPRGRSPEERDDFLRTVRTTGARLVILGQREDGTPPEATVLPRFSRRRRLLEVATALAKTSSPARLTKTGRHLAVVAPREDGQPPRVLLVEDNAVNQMIVKAALAKLGISCTIAANGRIALDELARSTFDLVLMDIQMPVMDGYEATRTIRARESGGARLPIVALTANSSLEDRENAFAAGVDAFLTKPVRIEELRAAVLGLTERRASAIHVA